MASTQLTSADIIGTGMYVPPRVVTNDELAKIIDSSDEWIRQRTGIEQRHYVDDETSPSDLALQASKKAIKNAGLSPKDIDFVMVATLSPDHYFPGTSAFLQEKLGLNGVPAMDVRCQCTGFIYGMSVAKSFVNANAYRNVLLCGTEVHSRALDMTPEGRDVAALFGDGSAAIVVGPSRKPEAGILDVNLAADGKYADKLWMEYPSMANKPFLSESALQNKKHFPKMDGRFVFKHAVRNLPDIVKKTLERNHLRIEDIDHFVFHQANLRINQAAAEQLGIPMEKVYSNIQKYGNCSAASIPICLDELRQTERLKSGNLVCLAGFGSGFTWGCAIYRVS